MPLRDMIAPVYVSGTLTAGTEIVTMVHLMPEGSLLKWLDMQWMVHGTEDRELYEEMKLTASMWWFPAYDEQAKQTQASFTGVKEEFYDRRALKLDDDPSLSGANEAEQEVGDKDTNLRYSLNGISLDILESPEGARPISRQDFWMGMYHDHALRVSGTKARYAYLSLIHI